MTDEKAKPVVAANVDKYVDTRSASGAKSKSCGDDVARCLEGLSTEDIMGIASKLLGEDLSEKYAHLNVGMQRMNMGNRLRKFVGLTEDGSNLAKLEKATSPIQNRNAKELEKIEKQKAKEAEAKAKEKAKAEADKQKAKEQREKEREANKAAKAKKPAKAKAAE